MTKGTKWMLVIAGMFLALALGMLFEGQVEQRTVSAQSPDGHSLDASDGDPTDSVFVDNEGNVGVGTTTPAGRLEISSPWSDWIFLRQESSTDGGGGFHIHNPWVGNDDESRNRLEVGYRTSTGEDKWGQLVIHGPTGNVGIGTVDPTAKLEISHDCSGCNGLYLTTTGDASGFNNTPFLTWHAPNGPANNKKYSMRFQADSNTFVREHYPILTARG